MGSNPTSSAHPLQLPLILGLCKPTARLTAKRKAESSTLLGKYLLPREHLEGQVTPLVLTNGQREPQP